MALCRFTAQSLLRGVAQGPSIRCASAATAVAPSRVREVLAQAPATELSELKNGFRVASENNGRPTATVGIWIDSGSMYEPEDKNGVARFVEHMCYRGTAKRAQNQLEKELESFGARLTSYTSRDRTAFYAQCMSRDVEKVVEILADVLRNSKFTDEKIELERNILLRELQESDQNPEAVVFDFLHQSAYQKTPFQASPLGSTEGIKSITRKDILDFQADHYQGVRMVLTGVGGVDHGKLTSMAEKYFGDVKNEYKQKIPPEKTAGIRFTGSEMTYRDDYVPWMYTAAAVEGVGLGHPDSVPLMVANAYVGQWDSSQSTSVNSPIPLAQKISTMPGIQAYQSFNINYRNTGLFGVYYVMDGKNLKETFAVATEITREWKYLATSCRDADLDRAKNILKTNVFQALESSAARADDIARQVLYYGHHLPQHELEKMIDDVDAKDVRRAMMAHVYDRDLAAGGYGRVEAFMPYLMMRYSMSWWRM